LNFFCVIAGTILRKVSRIRHVKMLMLVDILRQIFVEACACDVNNFTASIIRVMIVKDFLIMPIYKKKSNMSVLFWNI